MCHSFSERDGLPVVQGPIMDRVLASPPPVLLHRMRFWADWRKAKRQRQMTVFITIQPQFRRTALICCCFGKQKRVTSGHAKQISWLVKDPDQPEKSKVLRVAMIGSPNYGKSTLSNQLLGRKVFVVSKKVHTTRARALDVLTVDDTSENHLSDHALH